MADIEGVSLPFMPIGGVDALKQSTNKTNRNTSQVPFGEIFANELDKLKFSSHAQSRLTSRDIDLSETEINRLETAVSKAESKGAKESLVIMDDKAFIVSVPNKTVITVVNQDNMKDQVITDIDSAVFA